MNFKSKKSGFNLIELLVVIAIIAILAAILFPVFAKVREKARQTTCLSNEKQMGLATLQYAQDYEEDYPLAQTTNWGANYDWTLMISPYVKAGRINGNFSTVNAIFSCPSFPLEPGTGASEQNQYKPLSDVFTDQTQAMPVSGVPSPPVTLNQIDHPADQVMIYESGLAGPYGIHGTQAAPKTAQAEVFNSAAEWVWGSGQANQGGIGSSLVPNNDCDNLTNITWANQDWWDSQAGGGCDIYPRYRHNGFSNMLFCDGHAKAVRKSGIDYANNIWNQAESVTGQNGIGPGNYY